MAERPRRIETKHSTVERQRDVAGDDSGPQEVRSTQTHRHAALQNGCHIGGGRRRFRHPDLKHNGDTSAATQQRGRQAYGGALAPQEG